MCNFFDVHRNQSSFPINIFLLMPVTVVICFPTVFCDFIFFLFFTASEFLTDLSFSFDRNFNDRLDSLVCNF